MRACGITADDHPQLRETDFYTSHEALLLGYEQALTRVDSTSGDWYATSGHMIWIGDRTRQPDHAHVEYCRGIKNPIGLKCGPSLTRRRPAAPDRHPQPGQRSRAADADRPLRRRTRSATTCQRLVRAVKREGREVVWSCDPMHGNTITAVSGYKTRPFDRILTRSAGVLRRASRRRHLSGGMHVEMTGKNVTECTGGARAISDDDLADRYHTHCDPRLNASQALELAFLVSDLLQEERSAEPKAVVNG